MAMKRILALLLALVCVCTLPEVSGCEPTVEPMATTETEIMPLDLELGSNTHIGEQFVKSYNCRKRDGAYLNFYVKNNGTVPVHITINGSYGRTIPAGSAGHITAPVTATLIPQTMTVKCVCVGGGQVNIFYAVAQRDIDTT